MIIWYKPPKKFRFCKKIKNKVKIRIDFKYFYNDYHQNRNNQCGIYCINFIIAILQKKNFKYFKYKNSELNDDKMILNRKKYFIKPENIKIKIR